MLEQGEVYRIPVDYAQVTGIYGDGIDLGVRFQSPVTVAVFTLDPGKEVHFDRNDLLPGQNELLIPLKPGLFAVRDEQALLEIVCIYFDGYSTFYSLVIINTFDGEVLAQFTDVTGFDAKILSVSSGSSAAGRRRRWCLFE